MAEMTAGAAEEELQAALFGGAKAGRARNVWIAQGLHEPIEQCTVAA